MRTFTAEDLCPICSGHGKMKQGIGERCWGYLSTDGEYAHCMREEFAGSLSQHPGSQGYPHRLSGPCKCGVTHNEKRAEVRGIGEAKRARIVAEYDYTDESGELLFQCVRKEPKGFSQRRPDGFGEWIWKLGDTRLVLYKLPEVIAAVAAGDRVFIVEGEKDVAAIRHAGGVATCNPMGAGKWREEYSRFLEGADVTIVADRGDGGVGIDHARTVYKSLRGVARSVVVVEAASGKDAHDHLGAGGTLEDFAQLFPVEDMRRKQPARWKELIVRRSLEPRENPVADVDIAAAMQEQPPPRWPTALEGEPTFLTGFQGVTFLVGGPSSGKTWLAVGSSLCAARAGWRVFYVAAEMPPADIVRRANAYVGDDGIPELWNLVEAGHGCSVEKLIDLVADNVDERRTLLVLDSISSFVDQSYEEVGADTHRIGPLRRLTMWAMNARRDSLGEVSFLLLSERNAAGETKGRFGDHKADLVVSMETDGEYPMMKRLSVTKAWGGECGPLGRFALDWQNSRLRFISKE